MDFPTEDQFRAAHGAPDLHSMVVRTQSEIEAALRTVISEALEEPHQLELDRLSFPLKVDLAIALRALTPSIRQTFLKLNRIRNEFAHNSRADFSEQAAKELMLTVPEDRRVELKAHFDSASTPRETLKIVFVTAYFEARGAVERLQHQKSKKAKLLNDISAYFEKYDKPQGNI